MYTLPDLPYNYDALAPTISEDIMKLHHSKHHQTYVDKLNAALEEAPDLKQATLVELLSDIGNLPDSVRMAIRNHGGGHYNHSLFWEIMAPQAGGEPQGKLGDAIREKWGSFEAFTDEFNSKALGLFGSGWVWLTRDLEILAMPNQDTPMMEGKGEPLMGLDVWEHAYYLDYKNKRDDYIKNWWDVVNWKFVEQRFTQ
ncbi:MAG: superoxide dismutase [Candidatus Saccharibacteria bacterium]|jgi:Fe-Mn family superoxide dismutase|nr:superoxide dismutase [Patescibacteria group bacterium]MCA9335435.1 superoxide dismutase [Candidatus Saccharibacteria bacterium]MCA9336650.1 superoxide dismutase [Candidatus Saccharibacteria bacterium]MCA9340507.1 superoxide dismutase [Candidatus Saccharibacteria bacterium]HPQ82383.1 superoxide dismutase [Candidatus Saccharimonas sp.]